MPDLFKRNLLGLFRRFALRKERVALWETGFGLG